MTTGTDKKLPISVVILAKNEEKNIEDCLESCKFANEIILVDDGSSDRTVELAKKFNAKIFERSLNGDWGSQQSFGINQTSQPWLLLLDCDERITPSLYQSIKDVIGTGEKKTYLIQRENHFKHYQAQHGTLRPDWVQRFFPNEGIRVEGFVHPKIISSFPEKKLQGRMIHFPYDNPDQYYRKLNQYAKLSAEKYFKEGRKFSFFRDIVLRPAWAAFKVYFINLGFMDGKIGFIFAANHYSYTLQKYIRYYLLKHSGGKF